MESSRRKILVLTDWYLPGYKAGGPIRSIANMVSAIGDQCSLSILTSDRDWGDDQPYLGVDADQWTSEGQTKFLYTSKEERRKLLKQAIEDVSYDHIYLNSFFSVDFTLLALLQLWRSNKLDRVVLAPRGMLGEGALRIKSFKKQLFIQLFKRLGLHRKLRWHATDVSERKSIERVFGTGLKIHTLLNFPSIPSQKPHLGSAQDRFVFVSRISPKKNLRFILECLGNLQALELDVVGEGDDPSYERQCMQVVKEHELNVAFHGAQPHGEVQDFLLKASFFVLPTFNENFGHAIIEALSAGCPVIISDQTPWNDLEDYGAGWVIPLADKQAWIDRLEACSRMSDEDYAHASDRARSYVNDKFDLDQLKTDYLNLFTVED